MPLSPRDYLEIFEVKNFPRVYLLGAHLPRRAYVFAQQVRAVNLVHALRKVYKPHDCRRILIVGGGASGLSAAAAALSSEYHVTICEQFHLLWVFNQTSNRHLSPKVATWPRPGWDTSKAEQVYLNWDADLATSVCLTMKEKWDAIQVGFSSKCEVYEEAEPDTIVKNGEKYLCTLKLKKETKHESFDIVLLAVGFGRSEDENNDYWADRTFQTFNPCDPSAVKNILIAGGGDGGLIDTLRYRFDNFNEQAAISLLRDRWPGKEQTAAIQEVIDVENRSLRLTKEDAPTYFHKEYGRIRTPELETILQQQLKRNVKVTLIDHSCKYPYSINANAINRFLISRLMNIDREKGFRWIGQSELSEDQKQIKAKDGTIIEDVANGTIVLRRFGSKQPLAKGPLKEFWENRPDYESALNHIDEISNVIKAWRPPQRGKGPVGPARIDEEFRHLIYCGDEELKLRIDSATRMCPHREFQNDCINAKQAAGGAGVPSVAWNVRPARDFSIIHLVYLRQLKEFHKKGFKIRIVIFDVLSSDPKRDQDRDVKAFSGAINAYVRDDEDESIKAPDLLEFFRVSEILKKTPDLIENLASKCITLSKLPRESMRPLSVLDHLLTFIVEESLCESNIGQHDILLTGGFEEGSYWSEARKEIVTQKYGSPLLLILSSITVRAGKTAAPASPVNSDLPLQPDDVKEIERKLSQFDPDQLDLIRKLFSCPTKCPAEKIAEEIYDEFRLLPDIQ